MTTLPKIPTTILIHGATGRMGRALRAVASGADGIALRGFLDPRNPGREPLDSLPFFDHIPSGDPMVDVVVDFSRPEAVVSLVDVLAGTGVRLVSGTTGLGQEKAELLEKYSQETAVFYDDNMSYGISVVKRLLGTAGRLLGDLADVDVVEYHHRGKKDHPSGTAYGLVRAVAPDAIVVEGRGTAPEGAGRIVRTHSVRAGGIPGEHHVHFAMDDEVVTISHQALSRELFARGALRAVQFIVGKPSGMFSMHDLTGV
jgi:4-hydroxy-tetrahydrodipicolinate reductase